MEGLQFNRVQHMCMETRDVGQAESGLPSNGYPGAEGADCGATARRVSPPLICLVCQTEQGSKAVLCPGPDVKVLQSWGARCRPGGLCQGPVGTAWRCSLPSSAVCRKRSWNERMSCTE